MTSAWLSPRPLLPPGLPLTHRCKKMGTMIPLSALCSAVTFTRSGALRTAGAAAAAADAAARNSRGEDRGGGDKRRRRREAAATRGGGGDRGGGDRGGGNRGGGDRDGGDRGGGDACVVPSERRCWVLGSAGPTQDNDEGGGAARGVARYSPRVRPPPRVGITLIPLSSPRQQQRARERRASGPARSLTFREPTPRLFP